MNQEYVVLVPLAVDSDKLYKYTVRGGVFTDLEEAQTYAKSEWLDALVALVSGEIGSEQRPIIEKQERK